MSWNGSFSSVQLCQARMARLTWFQAVYQLIFRTVDSKWQCAALERVYNNVLIMSPGGSAYLKLGANSSIYRTCLPALGTGQAVGWSRVFYLLLSLPYWIYWHKHRQKCWPAFPSAIRWCHIVQRMPCKGVCRISLTRAHSLGFAHACCSCNALRPLTINLVVVIWIFSVIVIRDHF